MNAQEQHENEDAENEEESAGPLLVGQLEVNREIHSTS